MRLIFITGPRGSGKTQFVRCDHWGGLFRGNADDVEKDARLIISDTDKFNGPTPEWIARLESFIDTCMKSGVQTLLLTGIVWDEAQVAKGKRAKAPEQSTYSLWEPKPRAGLKIEKYCLDVDLKKTMLQFYRRAFISLVSRPSRQWDVIENINAVPDVPLLTREWEETREAATRQKFVLIAPAELLKKLDNELASSGE